MEQGFSVLWAHVIDSSGSADYYDSEQDAREMLEACGGGLERIVTTTIVPFVLRDDKGL